MEFKDAIHARRSRYDLRNTSPLTNGQLKQLLEEAIVGTPSAFHSQTSRVLLLVNGEHQKVWNIVEETLRKIVPAESFAPTKEKIDSFAKAYGTILYFEDMNVVEKLQKDFALYADNFPVWSQQSSGMLQYVVWTKLAEAGLGASLQHYNPLIDEEVKKQFGITGNWKLIAQMPFGEANSEPDALTYQAIEERLFVKGD